MRIARLLRVLLTTLSCTGLPRGFSTVETSAVIGAVSVLTATAAPHLQEYIDIAHQTKALGDVKVIAVSILRLWNDVGRIGGTQRVRPALLVTDGTLPQDSGPSTLRWTAPLDEGGTQSLAAHLLDNAAGYPVDGRYPRRWRGPYQDGLSADPWGSRYAINVGGFEGPAGQTIVVLSAGPNRIVETPFMMTGLHTGGDDVAALVASIHR
jgi:hypothetical protein